MRKTNNVVSEQVRRKPSCTSTDDDYRLQIFDLEGRGIVLSVLRKTKAQISFAADLRLVFAYAKCCFSHDAVQLR